MKIISQQDIIQRQSDNYIANELSNAATVLQTPQLFVDYFSVDADLSTNIGGFRNIEDYIGPTSNLVYNEIENLPMSGIDNLVTQSEFEEELGHEENLQSQGIIFPNTIVPKEGDMFTINGSQVPALYIVDGVTMTTARSNPFVEISFRLFSRDTNLIKLLQKQVKDKYMMTVSALGADKNLVIKKESYFKIQDHVKNYVNLADMYRMLFYDRTRSAFIYDGIYDKETDATYCFLDITLWKMMFDEGIVIYDSLIFYAINNYKMNIQPIYMSCPDIYIDDYTYRRSILYRLYSQDHKNKIDEFKYPQSYSMDPRIGKWKGKHLIYFENYGTTCDCNLMCTTCPEWDDEFMQRIVNNDKYETDWFDEKINCQCTGCEYINGEAVKTDFNPHLRNAIISWWNREDIDWENLVVEDKKTCENYFLIPIILGAYKKYIQGLQK